MAPDLTQMTPVGPEVVPLLVIITPGIPYAIGFALQASAQVPQILMKQLNPWGSYACLLLLHAPLLSPQACREPHHRLFFPWKGSGHFFLLGGIAIRCTKKRCGGSRSGMALLTMALLQGRKRRGHSAVQTEWRNGPWATEVTSQQRSSDHGAWGGISGPP
jgi:hypothetical protein